MNVLPLTLTFILILSILSLSFFESAHHTDYLAYQKKSYMQAKRQLSNKLEAVTLRSHLPKKPSTEGGGKKSSTPRTHYVSPRLKGDLPESAKLDISSLFVVGKAPERELEKIFTRLLFLLYDGKTFFQKEEISPLVKALIAQGKKKSPELLTDLYPEDPKLKEIFYKMLKSKTPLSDYVVLTKDQERKPLCFRKATIPLLQATFGKEVTKTILEKEEANYLARETGPGILTKEELQEILTHSGFKGEAFSLCQFSSPTKEKTTFHEKDPQAGVSLSYTTHN